METPVVVPFASFPIDAAGAAVDAIPHDRRIVLLGKTARAE